MTTDNELRGAAPRADGPRRALIVWVFGPLVSGIAMLSAWWWPECWFDPPNLLFGCVWLLSQWVAVMLTVLLLVGQRFHAHVEVWSIWVYWALTIWFVGMVVGRVPVMSRALVFGSMTAVVVICPAGVVIRRLLRRAR